MTKKGHYNFWRPKCGKRLRIPKFADTEFVIKNGSFFQTVCGRPQGEGVRLMWVHVDMGRGSKARFSCGRHKWMTPDGGGFCCWCCSGSSSGGHSRNKSSS